MTTNSITPGKTTIAVDVLLTVARLTTLGVPGVNRMGRGPANRVKGLLRMHNQYEGVDIDVRDDIVYADLYVILDKEVNVRQVGSSIQQEVSRAIMDIVGMQVGWINVHVEDIHYLQEPEAA
jgi:uncharacterized alkaline shock family protein YloU